MIEKIKDRKVLSLAAFVVVAALVLVLCALVAKAPIVTACILLVVQVAMAVCLHNAQIWVHGIFGVIELVAGILSGQVLVILFMIVAYVAATVALKFYNK